MERDRNAVTLRFRSPKREAAFIHQALSGAQRTNRRSLLLGLALFAGFALVDPLLRPGSVAPLWPIHAAIAAVLVGAYALIGSARVAARATLPALVASVLVMGFGFVAIPILSGGDPAHYYYGALFVLILFAHGLVSLPFIYATAACWLVTLAYLVLVNRPGGASMPSHVFLLLAANAFGMYASYTRENAARTAFLLSKHLARQRRSLERTLRSMRRMGRALERSEKKYHSLVDAMNEGLVTADAQGRITWLNQSMCEMTGYTPDEAIGRNAAEFLDEQGRKQFAAELSRRQAGVASRYAIEWYCKDGSKLSTLVSPHPFYAEDGTFQGSTAVVTNVTPLKEAQAALARSERHFRELVDNAQSIVLRWDADGTIRFINPYGSKLLGYTPGELYGRHVIGTIVPETDSSGKDLAAMIRDICLHPERYLYNENEIRDRDDNRFWIVWTNRAITDAEGRVTELLSIGTDITELKHAREALARQRDKLADLNAFLRRAFGRYVSEAVVRRVLESPDDFAVAGRRVCVTVLVADIRGFSALCETRPPEQVVALLNTYLESMTAVIQQYEGTIDEILGDGVLVIFGAPFSQADHAERAVACALAMQLAMAEVNLCNAARDLPRIEMGIGIDTGEIVAGSIGSTKRAKYGVVGPTVNRAARIESCTVGGQILASVDAVNAVGETIVTGATLEVQPKGSSEPVQLLEVTGLGSRHQLFLTRETVTPEPLATPLECEWSLVDEKFVKQRVGHARITAVSEGCAALDFDEPLPALTDLRLVLIDAQGEPSSADVYAKVVGPTEQTAKSSSAKAGLHRTVVRFTAVSEPARQMIAGHTQSVVLH